MVTENKILDGYKLTKVGVTARKEDAIDFRTRRKRLN